MNITTSQGDGSSGYYSDDPLNRQAVAMLSELDNAGLRNKAIAEKYCGCHPSHLSQVKAGNHRATTELVGVLRGLTLRFCPPAPTVEVLSTCKGSHVKFNDEDQAKITMAVLAALPPAWGGKGQQFDPPAGIKGVLVKVTTSGAVADIYLVVVRSGLAEAERDVVAHELGQLEKVYRKQAATGRPRPPRPDY